MTDVCFHRLRVAEVVAETADSRSLIFDLPAGQAERFGYRPGQFLTLRIPSDRCGSVARAYSLSSSPHVDRRPKVTVKLSSISEWRAFLIGLFKFRQQAPITLGVDAVVIAPVGHGRYGHSGLAWRRTTFEEIQGRKLFLASIPAAHCCRRREDDAG